MYLEQFKRLFHKTPVYIKSYLLFELGYYLYSKVYTYRKLDSIQYKDVREHVTHKITKELYEQLKLYLVNEPDLTKWLSDAFLDKELITLPNISTLLSYKIYDSPNRNVDELLSIVKIKCAPIIKPSGPLSYRNMSSIMMTNNLNITHKPFAYYTAMYFIRKVFNFYMYTSGFTNIIDPSTRLRIWVKYNKNAVNKTPLVFIHGFGLGIVPYVNKIRKLSVDRTLILPELPNISYDLYTAAPPPSADNIADALYDILVKRGVELIDIMGHSYGTMILNIFQNKYPHMCNYKTYAEPVCFYIQYGQMASTTYNFSLDTCGNILMYLAYLFVYRDMYIQYINRRSMFMEHFLIKNLDDKTHIILAKDDRFVPSSWVYAYITRHYPHIKIDMIDGGHGSFLLI